MYMTTEAMHPDSTSFTERMNNLQGAILRMGKCISLSLEFCMLYFLSTLSFQLSFVSWLLSQVLLCPFCVPVSIFSLCLFSSNLHKNTCSILKMYNPKVPVLSTEIISALSRLPSPAWCYYPFPPWDHVIALKNFLWSLSVEQICVI